MSKSKKNKLSSDPDVKSICRNRRATHEYQVESSVEAGLVLTGSEVKSLRQGKADLVDAYATYRDGELFLVGAHIAAYDKASHFNHNPRRDRKLLLQKRVIIKFGAKIREKGYTLIPLQLYFRKGWAKIEIGLAKGRKQHDNRDLIRAKEERREMRDASRRR